MRKLRIAEHFALPLETVTQTIVVYGGRGMGKTNLGSVLAEELYKARLKFSVIDPMGVWWGLQHGANRGKPGIEVLLLGGIRGDIPVEPTAGAVIADLVVDEAVSTVVDISRHTTGKMWSKGEKIKFVADYCTRLYERQGEKRNPVLQIIDEAARYCPQMIPHGSPDVARCAGAVEMLVEEGRNIGIGMVTITQRSARLAKSVAELSEVMIAFRTVGPNSIKAVMDWLGEHIEKARHKEFLTHLRSLPVGSALLISPGWLHHEDVVHFRARETFDSSATPKHGKALRAPGKARKPNLEKYKTMMAETIEKAKQNDPAALRREIVELRATKARLERHVKTVKEPQPAKERMVEVSVLKSGDADKLNKIVARIDKLAEKFTIETAKLTSKMEKAQRPGPVLKFDPKLRPFLAPAFKASSGRIQIAVKDATTKVMNDIQTGQNGLLRGERKMLEVLVRKDPVKLTRTQLGTLCGLKASGGTFLNYFGRLKRNALIQEADGEITLTVEGRQRSGVANVTPLSQQETIAMWRQKLLAGERRLLDALLAVHPDPISREELGKQTNITHTGGTFLNYLGTLRRNGLAEVNGQEVRAGEALFI